MVKKHIRASFLISIALYSLIALAFAGVLNTKTQPAQKTTSVTLSSFQEEVKEQPQNNQVCKSQPKQTTHQKTHIEKKQPEQQIKSTDSHVQNSVAKEESIVKNESVVIPVKQPLIKESINTEKEYLKINKAKIREAIAKHQRYPASAIKMDYEGTCTVRFKLYPSGKVEGIKVVESSGFASIDKSAIQAVEDAASEMPKPNESVTLTIPIGYTLH
jgi:periplasmic protein TonB